MLIGRRVYGLAEILAGVVGIVFAATAKAPSGQLLALGGEDGRTLFMLTAPSLGEDPAASARGKVVVADVDVGRAGLP